MSKPLKVLMVEDNPADAELALLALRSAGFAPDWQRVDTEAAYLDHLHDGLDLVLSDFQMPQFNGLRALELLMQSGLDIPFILVSGTIGEETAVAAIKSGATDYLMKDRLARLGSAVTHALEAFRLHRDKRTADAAAQRQLSELRVLFDLMPALVWFKDTENRILRVSQKVAENAGKSVAEIEGKPSLEIYPHDASRFYADDLEVIRSGVPKLGYVETVSDPTGKKLWVQTDKVPVRDKDGKIIGLVVMAQDITERKQVEESLQLLNSAVLQSKESVLITDAQLDLPGPRILFVNPAFTSMTGYTAEEVIGKTPRILQGPRTDRRVLQRLRENLEKRESFEGETINYRKDGSEFILEWQIAPIRNAGGETTHFVAIQRDITERHRARIAASRLAAIVDSSNDAIIGKGLEGLVSSWNTGAERIFGYTASEIVGTSILRLVPADRHDEELQIMEKVRQGKSVEHFETLRRTKDGRLIDISVTVSPIKDAAGGIIGIAKVARDITERKRANEALLTSEQRFKTLFDQAAVGVALSDVTTGRFAQVNQRFAEFLGYSREELVNLTVAAITHSHEGAHELDAMQRLKAGTIREYTREKRYVRKDGAEVWGSLTVSAMWAPGESPGLCIAVVLDITERRRLNQHFLQAQKMEALGQFSGGVAHDFNNILATISGYTELARMTLKENPEVREFLGSILEASGRAADLVKQILTFSRQQPQERQTIQLRPVVKESIKLLRATIPSTIEFDTALAADAPTVLANANQIHQILMNLGINAWHAMKDRTGRLKITLEKWEVDEAQAIAQPRLRPGSYARVSVGDTGSGMDAATLRRIFEPFFTTKPVGEGTGLGLAVVHGIMDGHDGAITVDSQPGAGTVFQLYFPANNGEAAVGAIEEGPVPHGNGEAVLVVDDEEVIASMLQQTLVRLGYAAEFTTSPAAVLDLVRTDPQRCKLVLADQTMPGMTGLVLATRLREIRPDLPVILMTGFSASLTPEKLEAAGVRQVLLKPLTVQLLGTALHAALAAPRPT